MRDEDIYTDSNGNEIPYADLIYDRYDGENDEPVYKYIDENDEEHVPLLSDMVYHVYNIGTIDHQSAGMLNGFLKSHNIGLREFLTNKKYVIVVDGDEYLEFDNMKDAGLINVDNIVEEYR